MAPDPTASNSATSNPTAPKCAFVIFGMSGDLAARKLVPALYRLHLDHQLHPETQIIGYARSDYDDAAIREKMEEALKDYVDDFDAEAWGSLKSRIYYVQGPYDEAKGYKKLSKKLDELKLENRAFYTATPPQAYTGIVKCMAAAGLNSSQGWTRVIIEKPFGTDLESAKQLNDEVLDVFEESQVYRIDHYLAKETAQNISALRFANTLFEPIWSNRYIDHVQITMSEPMGMEGRGGFYEEAGVIRDVFQNHLLQLLALVAMEPPTRYDAGSVRSEKVKVFEATTCLGLKSAVLGQYVAGNGLSAYRDEEGVAKNSRQATYAAVTLEVCNWRWTGVPFYLRSGKALNMKATEIVLKFKQQPHIPFDIAKPPADRLVLRVVPNEGISFRFNAKQPGQGVDLKRASMNFYYDEAFNTRAPDAYETLILDAMRGDATLFMRADEVEAQWRIVDPLLNEWESAKTPPVFYEAGSWGPKEADELLEDAGRYWHRPGGNA